MVERTRNISSLLKSIKARDVVLGVSPQEVELIEALKKMEKTQGRKAKKYEERYVDIINEKVEEGWI